MSSVVNYKLNGLESVIKDDDVPNRWNHHAYKCIQCIIGPFVLWEFVRNTIGDDVNWN